jgi:hypothetical protein
MKKIAVTMVASALSAVLIASGPATAFSGSPGGGGFGGGWRGYWPGYAVWAWQNGYPGYNYAYFYPNHVNDDAYGRSRGLVTRRSIAIGDRYWRAQRQLHDLRYTQTP